MWRHDSGSVLVLMSLMMVAFWTIVVVAVIWVTRASRSPDGGGDEEPTVVDHDTHTPIEPAAHHPKHGHSALMIACCIPMLVIAGVLVATGAVSPTFLLYAVGCTVMMAMMMRGMHGARDDASEVHSHR